MPRAPWGTILTAIGLIAALGFVFAVQYTPHLATFDDPPAQEDDPGLLRLGTAWVEYATGEREGFPWAIHVDEHYHMNVVQKVRTHERLVSGNPYSENVGEFSPFTSLRGALHESGYHLALAQAQEVTGVSTYDLYKVLPALWTTLIAFGVYALVRPHPAAIPAAAIAGLIPTTVRFLGTGFLVPIGVSLAWLPAAAILAKPATRNAASAALLLAVTVWAFFIHLMAGLAALTLVLLTGLFSSGTTRKAAMILVTLSLLPALWLYRAFQSGVQQQIAREETLPIDFTIFDNFGLITLFLWSLGVAMIVFDPPDREMRPAVTAFAALSGVAMAAIVANVLFDINRYALYSRMHPIFFLTASIPVAFAITGLARGLGQGAQRSLARLSAWREREASHAWVKPTLAILVGLALLVPAASQAVGYHVEEPYYRVMEQDTWEAYNHVEANLTEEGSPYEKFLSHPWQAPFLMEKTGKQPHTVMSPGAPPVRGEHWLQYMQGQHDPTFFVMNDITLVVGPRPPPGDFWEQTAPDVWIMEEPYAERIQQIRNR